MSFAYNVKRCHHLFSSSLQKSSQSVQKLDLSFNQWLNKYFPTFSWDEPHLLYIQSYLEKILKGEINRLMIFCPPRHGKSEMTTIRFPVYCLNCNPYQRIIVGAYSQTLVDKFSRKSRRIAKEILNINPERSAVEDWETIEEGGYRAVGVGGGIIGQGGNGIIIDDPVKNRQEANSLVYREKVWEWFTDDLYTRLEPNGWMILIMTRWHEDDLAGRILASDFAANWNVISLPAFAEKNDALKRAEEEALWPSRFDTKALLRIKKVLGNNFEALYQQRPTCEEGEVIPINDIQIYKELPICTFILQSWDTAFKDKEENDFSVGTTWGVSKDGFYIIDRWKQKAKYPFLKSEIRRLAYKYNPNAILIEDKASGQSLIQDLQHDSRLPIIAIKVDRDKISRAHATTDLIIAHRIFVPFQEIWVKDFLHNLSVFPNGVHDDDVDSFTMAVNYLSKRYANTFPVYPDYNDYYYAIDTPIEEFNFVQLSIGVHIDSMASSVIIGLTPNNQAIVIDEYISETGINDLLNNYLFPYLIRNFKTLKPLWFVKTDRDDIKWYQIFEENNIEVQNLSNIAEEELIENVKILMTHMIKGCAALLILLNYCPDVREGFFGAYNYKARSNKAIIDYQEKPIKNKYSRLHQALQSALYYYKTIVDMTIDLEDNEMVNRHEEGRNQIGGY